MSEIKSPKTKTIKKSTKSAQSVQKSTQTVTLTAKAVQKGILTKEQVQTIQRFEEFKQIAVWEDYGLITSQQKEDLCQMIRPTQVAKTQQSRVSDSKTGHQEMARKTQMVKKSIDMGVWIKYVSLFAIGCIVLGLIAMIAANWQEISPVVKLCGYFIGSIALLIALFGADSSPKYKNHFVKECCLWLNIGWIFAGIGLIGQIFHLTGSFWNALLFGSILSTPFVLASTTPVSVTIWSVGYMLGAIFGVGNAYTPLLVAIVLPVIASRKENLTLNSVLWGLGFLGSFFPHIAHYRSEAWPYVCWIALVLPIVLWQKKNAVLSVVWWLAFLLVLIFQLGEPLSRLFGHCTPVASVWLFLSVLFCINIMCAKLVGKTVMFTKFLKGISVTLAVISVLYVEARYALGYHFSSARQTNTAFGLFGGAAMPLIFIGLFMARNTWKPLLQVWAVSWSIAFIFNFLSYPMFGMIFTLICLLGGSIYAIRIGKMGLLKTCLILMGLRVVIAYFDLIVSLMSTGVGLVVIGIVLLLGLWFWAKVYPVLVQLVKQQITAQKGGKHE